MNLFKAEWTIYRSSTVAEFVEKVRECRDYMDIHHVMMHTLCRSPELKSARDELGIRDSDFINSANERDFGEWKSAVGKLLGIPRLDEAAEKARKEKIVAIMDAPDVTANTSETDLSFDAHSTAKLFTRELARKILATEPNRTKDDDKVVEIAAGVLYCLRTFLPSEERARLGKPPEAVDVNEDQWLQDAQKLSIATRLPHDLPATKEQEQEALRIIRKITGVLEELGYTKYAGALRNYTDPAPFPRTLSPATPDAEGFHIS